jgi:hypothetical protein
VAAPAPGTVVLFLAGDPALAERQANPAVVATMWSRFLPANFVMRKGTPPPRDPDAPGPFPPDQLMCAQRLLDAAKLLGRSVKIVDVNRPGEDRELVRRWVSAADILPILLRSDGNRLEGAEAFHPATLRGFLAPP